MEWRACLRRGMGLTIESERLILLSYYHARSDTWIDPIEVLVHELFHLRYPEMNHGREFSKRVNGLLRKLNIEGSEDEKEKQKVQLDCQNPSS